MIGLLFDGVAMFLSETSLLYKLLILSALFIGSSSSVFADNETVEFTPQEVRQLTGHYSTSYGYFHIRSNNGVVTTLAEGKRIYLRKKEDGLIYPVYKLLGLIPFAKDDMAFSMKWARGRQLVILHTQENGKKITSEVGEKFTPIPLSKAWQQRVGQYKLVSKSKPNTHLTFKLYIKNNLLIGIRSDDDTPYPLLPRSDTSAIIPGSDEGHLVDLTVKNNQLFLLVGKNSYQLIKQ